MVGKQLRIVAFLYLRKVLHYQNKVVEFQYLSFCQVGKSRLVWNFTAYRSSSEWKGLLYLPGFL